MKQRLVIALALLCSFAPLARAFTGVNLRWDACIGDGGALNRNSACASNTGVNGLVGSFILASDMTGVTGIEIVVDIAYAGSTVPPWFQFFTAGSCRQSALTTNPTLSPLAVNCADWAADAAAGGLAAYQSIGFFAPNMARVKLAFAVAVPVNVTAGPEWFAFNLNISNAKTVGLGSCAGCSTPACIVFNSANVVPGTQAGVRLAGPTNGVDSNYATWQGAIGVSTLLGNGCPRAVPVRNRSWGELKSLYR